MAGNKLTIGVAIMMAIGAVAGTVTKVIKMVTTIKDKR